MFISIFANPFRRGREKKKVIQGKLKTWRRILHFGRVWIKTLEFADDFVFTFHRPHPSGQGGSFRHRQWFGALLVRLFFQSRLGQ